MCYFYAGSVHEVSPVVALQQYVSPESVLTACHALGTAAAGGGGREAAAEGDDTVAVPLADPPADDDEAAPRFREKADG